MCSFSCVSSSFRAFFLLVLHLPWSLSFYIPDSSPLLSLGDHVRERHLYTENHRRGLYLELSPDGRVSGSPAQTHHSVLELRSVGAGQTVIKGVSSSLYLCIDSGGRLRGQSRYTEADCSFRELLLADGYTRFVSSHHRLPVSLASNHSPERHHLPFTRFLPLRNSLAPASVPERHEPQSYQGHLDMDAADPLGMSLDAMASPLFSVEK